MKQMGAKKWLGYGLLGLVVGACLALVGAAALLLLRSNRLLPAEPALRTTPFATLRSGAPEVSVTVTPTLDPLISTLEDAEAALESGNLARARDLLPQLLDQTSDPALRARINGDLGDLEIALGRYRLASVYIEQQYAFEKNPEVLFKLANTYATCGMLEQAEPRYQELLDWPDSRADPYRDQARYALVHVRDMLGTHVPTLTP